MCMLYDMIVGTSSSKVHEEIVRVRYSVVTKLYTNGHQEDLVTIQVAVVVVRGSW